MADKPKVAVFGHGVAGLTAAHELALRGAEVTIYGEEGEDELGGKAASQEVPYGTVVLPGEHGFRFFPAFYRHLTDTMRRIPFWSRGSTSGASEPRDAYVSCADNLVPTYNQAFAAKVAGQNRIEVFAFERTMPRSIESVTRAVVRLLSRFGYTPRDLVRYQLKLFQYATSSARRRLEQYERLSWWDFLEGQEFSPIFQRHLNVVPRVLLAMDAKKCDARTQGNVTVQLMADYLSAGDDTDRTMNGPTSEQWIKPWYRFLKDDLHVKFRFEHELTALQLAADGTLEAVVLDKDTSASFTVGGDVDYVILALPLRVTRALLHDMNSAAVQAAYPADYPELNQLAGWPSLPGPSPDLAWMAGVQFYFGEDIPVLPGHIYFPDSAWGLSLVSQGQFWGGDFPTRFGGGVVRGVISVDIADWDSPAGTAAGEPAAGLTARQATHDQVIEEVWFQLTQALGDLRGVRGFPLPDAYLFANLDQELPYLEPGNPASLPPGILDPSSPGFCGEMTVTTPGSWGARPGELPMRHVGLGGPTWKRPSREERRRGYPVRLGKLFFAGEHTQTYTGLPTMEAANEAARHAVNGIITDLEKAYKKTHPPSDPPLNLERCEIWNLEETEPADLDFFKRLDEKLIEQVLAGAPAPADPLQYPPHFVEILGFEELIELVLDNSSGLVDGTGSLIDLLSSQLAALSWVQGLIP